MNTLYERFCEERTAFGPGAASVRMQGETLLDLRREQPDLVEGSDYFDGLRVQGDERMEYGDFAFEPKRVQEVQYVGTLEDGALRVAGEDAGLYLTRASASRLERLLAEWDDVLKKNAPFSEEKSREARRLMHLIRQHVL